MLPMKENTFNKLKSFFLLHLTLEECKENILKSFDILYNCCSENRKIMICGNGGSSADAEHIVAELMKDFQIRRPIDKFIIEKINSKYPKESSLLLSNLCQPIKAISLVSQHALISAYSNDMSFDMSFAQQVLGYGVKGDVLIGISTSGNSKNIINACKIAKALDIYTIGMTGNQLGLLDEYCDVIIKVPSDICYEIQEYHQAIYHLLCSMLELEMFS